MGELTTRLAQCYTGAIHDVLRAMGHERVVLPPEIRPLDPALKVAGPVWTVSGHIDRTQSAHETLLGWTGLLSKAPPGRVVVCQPQNHEVALMGELSAETLKGKGVLGYVVDGGCRDVEFILKIGFPVFASFFTPSDIVGRWIPDRYGEPITIGAVTIRDGDYLLGDLDGVRRGGDGEAGRLGLPQPARHPSHPHPIHVADPLAQRESGEQPGAHPEGGPEQRIASAQSLFVAHGTSSYERFLDAVKLIVSWPLRRESSSTKVPR